MRISDWSSDVCSSDLLAGEAVVVLHDEGLVQHVDLLLPRVVQLRQPAVVDVDVTGGAGAGAAALGLDRQAMVADDLHYPPAFHRVQGVLDAVPVGDVNLVVFGHFALVRLSPRVRGGSRCFVSTAREDHKAGGHATPSFFCRLVEEVVYWKRSFSPGLT